MERAYSLLEVKSIDEDKRIIEGIATTPSVDRVGDVVEPKGAEFKLPIPLLWQHNPDQPIGEVFAAKVTSKGIEIKARIERSDEPGLLKDLLDFAWQCIKKRLVRGLSIGFQGKARERIEDDEGHFTGIRFMRWLWLELSAVTIPANQDASILAVKKFDTQQRAASGQRSALPGVSGLDKPKIKGSKTVFMVSRKIARRKRRASKRSRRTRTATLPTTTPRRNTARW